MGSFVVEDGRFGNLETIRLADPASGASAVVARRGATLLSWHPGIDGTGDWVDGYVDEAEFAAQSGVHNGVMAPFSNRVRGGRYRFDGAEHELPPVLPGQETETYHGFLRLLDCDVLDTDTEGNAARVRLGSRALRPGAFPGYPFAVDLEVEWALSGSGLTLEITGRNVGDRAAPYGCGWHPYFRIGTRDVDPLELQVPARTAIRTDDALIPLDGDQAFVPVPSAPGPTFHGSRPVGDAVLDAAFTDLEPDPDGIVRTRLRDPRSGLALTVWQHSGLMHVFTGDTLGREPRTSIALEPVELMTDAYNRPDCRDAIRLPAGEQRSFRCGVEASAS
jgi:aldose 1-epimerase